MEIRLLKSPEDLLKAYNLVYKIYIKEGFISSNNLELRVRENYELTDHIYRLHFKKAPCFSLWDELTSF